MHAELALHIIPHHPCSFRAVDTNARRIYLPIRAASAHTAPRHDANPPTQHANPAGRQQLPAPQRRTGPRQLLLQTFQVVQIVHPDAHNHVHACTLEPLAAFAFIVDHTAQRTAVHHLRIPVFHEPVELDHNNPTIARAPQKIDAVPFARLRVHEFHLLGGGTNPHRIIAASTLASPPFSANGVAKRNTFWALAFISPSRVAHAMISVLLVPLRSAQHMTSIAGMNGMLFAQTAAVRAGVVTRTPPTTQYSPEADHSL